MGLISNAVSTAVNILKGDEPTRAASVIIDTSTYAGINERMSAMSTSTEVANNGGSDKLGIHEEMATASGVRRPLRNVQIKEDTYATISIVKEVREYGEQVSALKNSSVTDDEAEFTANFMLQSVTESRQEKHQVVTTFGKDYIYFFGQRPRQISFNAVLMNSENFRWEEEWWVNYDNVMRGTALVSKKLRIRIRFDDTILYGYLLQCSTNKSAMQLGTASLSFTVHVVDGIATRSDTGTHLVSDRSQGYNDVDLSGSYDALAIGKDELTIAARNLEVLAAGDLGLIDTIDKYVTNAREAVSSGIDSLLSTVQDYADFMYGRELVIPADMAYDQLNRGNPQFAGGTDMYNKLLAGEAITINIPAAVPGAFVAGGSYTDNIDEYPLMLTKYPDTFTEPKSVPDFFDLLPIARALATEYDTSIYDFIPREDGTFTAAGAKRWNDTPRLLRKAGFFAFQVVGGIVRDNISINTIEYPEEDANIDAYAVRTDYTVVDDTMDDYNTGRE